MLLDATLAFTRCLVINVRRKLMHTLGSPFMRSQPMQVLLWAARVRGRAPDRRLAAQTI